MKIIQSLVLIASVAFAIKQVLNLLENEINKCDDLPEIEED